jgi:hypothetical protein
VFDVAGRHLTRGGRRATADGVVLHLAGVAVVVPRWRAGSVSAS